MVGVVVGENRISGHLGVKIPSGGVKHSVAGMSGVFARFFP